MQKLLYILIAAASLAACKKKSETVEVPTAITTDYDNILLLGLANQEDSFRITTNRSWKITVEPAANWLQLSAAEGKGDLTIKLKHTNDATQEANVTLTISDITKQVADKKIQIKRQPFYVAPSVKMVGGTKDDTFTKAYATSDGGFIVVGSTKSYDGDMNFRQGPEVNYTDGLVIKFSATGTIQWKRAFGGNSEDVFNTVAEVPGGGYILAGKSSSNDGDFSAQHGFGDTWIMKIDSDGNKVWNRLFGGNSEEAILSVIISGANEIIAVGESMSNDGNFTNVKGNTNKNALWMKVSPDGTLNSAKGLGTLSSIYYQLNCITESSPGHFLLSGMSNGGVSSDLFLLEVDAAGSINWSKVFQSGVLSSHINSGGNDGFQAGTAGAFPGREISSKFGLVDGLLLRTSHDGSRRWHQQYGGSGNDEFKIIVNIPSLGYLMAGSTASNDHQVKDNKGATDGWAVLVDESGKLLWSKTIGGAKDDKINDAIILRNKKTVLIGTSNSTDGNMNSRGNNDGFVMMFD